MRATETFTDGRIHVTLCDGPFDLRGLTAAERRVYEGLLGAYAAGATPATLEHQRVAEACGEALEALGRDLVDRACVVAWGEVDEDELLPWRPEAMRAWVQEARSAQYRAAG